MNVEVLGKTATDALPKGHTFEEMQVMELPEVEWTLPHTIPEGFTLRAGAPKEGKSAMAEWDDETVQASLPELPNQKRERYSALGINDEQVETIIGDRERDIFFSAAVAATDGAEKVVKTMANYFTSDVLGGLESSDQKLTDANATHFAQLATMATAGDINSRVAKDLLFETLFSDTNPQSLAESRGLLQQSSEDDLLPIVTTIVSENESVVADYKAGKDSALQFLVGQGMKATKGTANPGTLVKLLKQELEK